jgi:hypothetical protein
VVKLVEIRFARIHANDNRASNQPTRNAHGEITGVANFAFDVTAQLKAHAQAESALNEARRLASCLDQEETTG